MSRRRRTPRAAPSSRGDKTRGSWLGPFDPEVPLALILLALVLTSAWSLHTRNPNIDYYQYWVVGQALRAGEAGNIYSQRQRALLAERAWHAAEEERRQLGRESLRTGPAEFRRYEVETYSSPWLYSVFAWSVTQDYDADQRLFQHLSLLCMVGSVFLLAHLLGYSLAGATLWAVVLVGGFDPTFSDVQVGNVNRIQLGIVTGLLMLLNLRDDRLRGLGAGGVLAAGVLFKPTLAGVALVLATGWALDRRRRELLYAAAGGAVGALFVILASSLTFGTPSVWVSWIREVVSLLNEFDHSIDKGNFSLVLVTRDGLGWGSSALFLVAFYGAVVAVLVASRTSLGHTAAPVSETPAIRGAPTMKTDLPLVALGAVLPLLASDLAWLHYFLLTIPMLLLLQRPVTESPATARWVRVFGLLALVLVARQPIGPLVAGASHSVFGFLAASGALLLYGLGLWELFEARTGESTSVSPPRPR